MNDQCRKCAKIFCENRDKEENCSEQVTFVKAEQLKRIETINNEKLLEYLLDKIKNTPDSVIEKSINNLERIEDGKRN